MTSQIRPAPVRKSIFVEASQAHAFDVFTREVGQWWPKSHKIGPVDVDRPIIEPREGSKDCKAAASQESGAFSGRNGLRLVRWLRLPLGPGEA